MGIPTLSSKAAIRKIPFAPVNTASKSRALAKVAVLSICTAPATNGWQFSCIEPTTTRSRQPLGRPCGLRRYILPQVAVGDFGRNPRGELGTRTATLDRAGVRKLRLNWIYRSQ